jgi:hypothetical protein
MVLSFYVFGSDQTYGSDQTKVYRAKKDWDASSAHSWVVNSFYSFSKIKADCRKEYNEKHRSCQSVLFVAIPSLW